MSQYHEYLIELSSIKRKKQEFKYIFDEVKKEIKDSYFKWQTIEDTIFRFVMCLYLGEYYGKYEHRFGSLSLSKGRIDKTYGDFYSRYSDTKTVGFICEKGELFTKIQYDMEDIWKQRVNQSRYRGSLAEFKDMISCDPNKCFIEYSEYCSDKNITLIEYNFPALKIKNIILKIQK